MLNITIMFGILATVIVLALVATCCLRKKCCNPCKPKSPCKPDDSNCQTNTSTKSIEESNPNTWRDDAPESSSNTNDADHNNNSSLHDETPPAPPVTPSQETPVITPINEDENKDQGNNSDRF